jgi:hypothetical protein
MIKNCQTRLGTSSAGRLPGKQESILSNSSEMLADGELAFLCGQMANNSSNSIGKQLSLSRGWRIDSEGRATD